MLCFTEKLEAIKEPKENAIDEKENGEGLTNGERQTDEMIDTGDKKIIVGDDIKIILKDDENDNKLEDIHKSDSLNHVQNNMDDVGKYYLVTFPWMYSIALIIYMYSVTPITGFIK